MKEYRYKTVGFFLGLLEPMIGRFITFHTRPIYREGVLIEHADREMDYSDYAIVIQGPLVRDHDFTFETIKLYKDYFKSASIILSTWEGEDSETLRKIRAEGVDVLLNKKPASAGPRNINLQIVSARAGILLAVSMKKKYLLKTRTDVRMYSSNALTFLFQMLMRFPLHTSGFAQKGRLISTHGSISKWYFFPDMMVFGYAEDVQKYFNPAFVADDVTALQIGDVEASFVPEQYFFMEFLKKIGYSLTFTDEDSRMVQARNALILDPESLDWYWCKYDRHLEYRHITYRRKKRIVGFPEWFILYSLYDVAP